MYIYSQRQQLIGILLTRGKLNQLIHQQRKLYSYLRNKNIAHQEIVLMVFVVCIFQKLSWQQFLLYSQFRYKLKCSISLNMYNHLKYTSKILLLRCIDTAKESVQICDCINCPQRCTRSADINTTLLQGFPTSLLLSRENESKCLFIYVNILSS